MAFADAEAFCNKARANNDRCTLHGYDEAGHGFFNKREQNNPWFNDTVLKMDSFLTQLSYLATPAATQVLGQ